MKTARRRLRSTLLREDRNPRLSGRVDRQRGVIHGVKLLGARSSNGDGGKGRRYTRECLEQAARLYEGAPVNVDHPEDPEDPRSAESRLGRIVNVRLTEEGLFGDLVLLKSHPLAERILEAAADPLKHRLYGMSHNANGEIDEVDGVEVVRQITEVRSVDLVADPATTRGLFESIQRQRKREKKPMKLREWIEKTKLLPPARKKVVRILEAYMDHDMALKEEDGEEMLPAGEETEPATAQPMSEVDPADMDPEEALRHGFRTAMVAVIDDNTLDRKAKVARLKELIDTADRLLASGEEIPEGEHEEPDGDEPDGDEEVMEGEDAGKKEDEPLEECDMASGAAMEKKKKGAAMESRQKLRAIARENRQLKAEKAARELCESEGVGNPSAALVKAVSLLESEAEKVALIQERKTPHRARSAAITEGRREKTTTSDPVEDLDAFVKRITSQTSN